MKKLLFYAAALLAAISFSACSDDDEEPTLPATPGNIAGTWQNIYEEGWEICEGEKETWSADITKENWYRTYSFDESGTYVETDYGYNEDSSTYEVDYTINGTYSISGNTITLQYYPYTMKIKKLTESRLVLVESLIDESEDLSAETITTYKRIE